MSGEQLYPVTVRISRHAMELLDAMRVREERFMSAIATDAIEQYVSVMHPGLK